MTIRNHSASIYFFLNGERYAYRVWPHVPRIGDEVMLGDGAGEKAVFQVVRVIYGVEPDGENDDLGHQAINVGIEPTPQEPTP